MKSIIVRLAMVSSFFGALLILYAPLSYAQDSETSLIPAAEKPFWESAQLFLDAYAKRDAKAIGELFTDDAEFVDEFGELTQGREAISRMYQEVFDSSSQVRMEEIRIERVRYITEDVVLEEGVVVSSETADGPLYKNRYVALHTKAQDGSWRINTVKDQPREAADRSQQLQQLDWLVGEWVSEDADSVVHTNCEWSEDGNYLLRHFSVQTQDGREMDGVQRIGWDPVRKSLRSWTFDSEGGFFNGLWSQNGNQWLVTTAGVTADGKAVTGTAVYQRVDNEMISWRYQDLIVGGETRSESQPITMVKRPPLPQDSPQ